MRAGSMTLQPALHRRPLSRVAGPAAATPPLPPPRQAAAWQQGSRDTSRGLVPPSQRRGGPVHAAASTTSGGGERPLPPGKWQQSPAGAAAARAAAAAQVDLAIEPGPNNARCVWAGVDVRAPAPAVFAALTSYERLGTFIPGLAENRCLERFDGGCRLLQVGQQDVALGLRFCARVVLRIREWPAGVPAQLLARSPNRRSAAGGGGAAGRVAGFWPFSGGASSSGSSGWGWPAGASSGSGSGWDSGGGSSGEEEAGAWSERRFLRPRSPLAGSSPMDLSFELCEGDFAAFRGLWRMQPAPDGAACRLSYTLFVRPQPWLPVGLVEARVAAEIRGNLAAVATHVEGLV